MAHVDMNSYFASVEQQANPFLRGKPVGVCAYLHEHGCVIAASVEAKKLGVRVGMSVGDARKACPDAAFVQNDPGKYRAVTSRVFSIFHELTDRVEHYSIDEAFLDLTGWYRDPAEAAFALAKVRRRIREEVGDWLRCSIGIAPTRFLAKTASDMQKPSGLVVITHENLDEVLSRLDLEDVCGIGKRIRRRLNRAGIGTLIDLKYYPVENLIRLFGTYGFYLWCKLHGLEFERTETPEEDRPKSIGHSYCVPNRVNQEGRVLGVLTKLAERAGRRLRREGMFAGAVSVAVGFRAPDGPKPNGPFWVPDVHGGFGGSGSHAFGEPAQDSFTLIHAACSVLHDIWHGEPVNFLAVTFCDLSEPSHQMRMDQKEGWFVGRDRRRLVSDAMDRVRDRYGDEAIILGSMFGADDEAPDRIGFRKTGELEMG